MTIACIHVVPHFGGVHTKMSPGRGVNRFHRRLSDTTLRYSRSIGRSTAPVAISRHPSDGAPARVGTYDLWAVDRLLVVDLVRRQWWRRW